MRNRVGWGAKGIVEKRDPVKGMRRPVGDERVENKMISAATGMENDHAPKSFLLCFHQIQMCFRFYFSSVTPFFAQ